MKDDECREGAGTIRPPLVCNLPEDHDGPHYDTLDNITWKEGRPDE